MQNQKNCKTLLKIKSSNFTEIGKATETVLHEKVVSER